MTLPLIENYVRNLPIDCDYYTYQLDNNGEVAICHCTHPDNPEDTEGNCRYGNCPLGKTEE